MRVSVYNGYVTVTFDKHEFYSGAVEVTNYLESGYVAKGGSVTIRMNKAKTLAAKLRRVVDES